MFDRYAPSALSESCHSCAVLTLVLLQGQASFSFRAGNPHTASLLCTFKSAPRIHLGPGLNGDVSDSTVNLAAAFQGDGQSPALMILSQLLSRP